MALIIGRVSRLGVVGTSEPVGRITVLTDESVTPPTEVTVNCTGTGPKFELAKIALQSGLERSLKTEIDVLNTTNPYIADKIRILP